METLKHRVEMETTIKIRQLKGYERDLMEPYYRDQNCIKCCRWVSSSVHDMFKHLYLCLEDATFDKLIDQVSQVSLKFVPNRLEYFLKLNQQQSAIVMPHSSIGSPLETRPSTPEFKHNLVEELMGIHQHEEQIADSPQEIGKSSLDILESEIIEQVDGLNAVDGKEQLMKLNDQLIKEKAKLSLMVEQFGPDVRDLVKEVCRNMLSEDLLSRALPEEFNTKIAIPNTPNRTSPSRFLPSTIVQHSSNLQDLGQNSQRDYIRKMIHRNNLSPAVQDYSIPSNPSIQHVQSIQNGSNSNLVKLNPLPNKLISPHISIRAQHAPVYSSVLKSTLDMNSSLKSSHLPPLQLVTGSKRPHFEEELIPSKSQKLDVPDLISLVHDSQKK